MVDFSDFLPTICDAAEIDIPSNIPIDGISFLPQLLGEKGKPRKWIYGWYSRDGKLEELKEFARNTDYKLYSTGEFYNVKDDFVEKHAIALDSLNKEEKRAYKSLIKAIGNYEDARKKNN